MVSEGSFRRRDVSEGRWVLLLKSWGFSKTDTQLTLPFLPGILSLWHQGKLKEGVRKGETDRQGMLKMFGTQKLPRRIRRESFIFTFF